MVGVQAGHETAHTCSADISRPAGSSPTGAGPSMSVPSGTKCRAWSAARSTPKAKSCPGDPALARSAAAQASTAACRSRRTTPASVSAVSTSITCLSNRTSSESLSQKRRQAARPAHTCGKPPSFGTPTAGMPGGGQPNSDPSRAAAVEDSRTERVMASYRRLPSLAMNPDTSSRPRRSNGGRASITDSKRGKRTSSTELQRTVADQLIRLVRLDCPDERRRAAAAGLSLAQ
jgi:hypothetical protein